MNGALNLKLQLVLPKLDGLDAGKAMSALRKASGEIERIVEPRVRARTPKDTGALREDVSGTPYTSQVSGNRSVNLVTWYIADDNQLAEWNRVYAPYQEGPQLGLSTYTNGPHQMLQRIETDDMDVIQAWADAVLAQWADDAAAEANASTTIIEAGES